jgi:FKBP-type peptidyl-prolyl cis-trans isomerase 2
MKVENGSKVKVEYEGKFEDGEVFDASSRHGQPLEFEVGAKQVVPGFENGILGMEVNQEKEVTIEAKDAYGEYNAEMTKEVPKKELPEADFKPGMTLGMTLPGGQQVPVKIKDVKEDAIVIDLNHPLAGKTLIFKLKVVEIN